MEPRLPESQTPESQTPESPKPALMLVEAATDVERRLVEEWLRGHGDGRAEAVPAGADELVERLAAADPDTLVTPVRVVWLPRERAGVRRTGWSDLATLTNPRRPRPGAQARIASREPDRTRVVEPGLVVLRRARQVDEDDGQPDGRHAARAGRQAHGQVQPVRACLVDRNKSLTQTLDCGS